MRLHNYIVDYRDQCNETNTFNAGSNFLSGEFISQEISIERTIFEDDCDDNGITSIVRGQDCLFRPGPKTTNDKDSRLKGLILRDKLRVKLKDHDMHRPRKNDWHEDNYMHVVRDN